MKGGDMTLKSEVDREQATLVYSGEGNWEEQVEMAKIMRQLADAIEQGDSIGNSLLVLEERCLERLKKYHSKAKSV
jgi:hypothetical protein